MKFKENYQLSHLNSFNLPACTRWYAQIFSTEELVELMSDPPSKRILVLGAGSNIVFSKDFDGLIIHNKILERKATQQPDGSIHLRCGAGEPWPDLVHYSVCQGWCGLENLALIPGSAGAAPVQNIGAYGIELGQVLVGVETYNCNTRDVSSLTAEQCNLSYRSSRFRHEHNLIVTAVTLRLSPQFIPQLGYAELQRYITEHKITPTLTSVFAAVCTLRNRKLPDPKLLGNAGSFFKNPIISMDHWNELQQLFPGMPGYILPEWGVKIPAAWLIEHCGWKGKRVGQVGISKNHALILVNYGDATGAEITNLAGQIQDSVKKHFGIPLEPEVTIV